MSDNPVSEPPAAPTGAEPQPSPAPGGAPPGPEDESKGAEGNDELRAFMEEYRADKKAAAEAKAAADAEAAAKKKVPAPQPKKKAAEPKAEPPKAEPPKERAYGSARWFNRKSKAKKDDD